MTPLNLICYTHGLNHVPFDEIQNWLNDRLNLVFLTPNGMPHHSQVPVERTIMIDEKIARLIKLIWQANLDTKFSCQCQFEHLTGPLVDTYGLGYILFDDHQSFRSFMEWISYGDLPADSWKLSGVQYKFHFRPEIIHDLENIVQKELDNRVQGIQGRCRTSSRRSL